MNYLVPWFKKHRPVFLLFILVLVFPSLACNIPVRRANPIDIDQSVRETLTALGTFQPPPPADGPGLEATPVPTFAPGVILPPDAQQTQGAQLPLPVVTVEPPPTSVVLEGDHYQYVTRPGDTLAALAGRFGVAQEAVLDPMQYPPQMMLPAGLTLAIPNVLEDDMPYSGLLLPDSEVLYSPASLDFSTEDYVRQTVGFLNVYTENVDGETLTGAQVIDRVAHETSINPRLLVAFLEYRSNWVFGYPDRPNTTYPIGFGAGEFTGLHKELTLVARQLTIGYYGWRSGKLTELEFLHRQRQRIHPGLNSGTVALQYLFSKLYDPGNWEEALYSPATFMAFYQQYFGDSWQRAEAMGPLLPEGLTQPVLELPFAVGESWSMTGGPHAAWGVGSPWGGLDFAPAAVEKGCTVSRYWTTAAAPGMVLRSERGMVLLDLDGDGYEQTGWVLLYLHVAQKDRIAEGTYVQLDQPLGHPSCEGGFSTGTHVHISRKYNGEWQSADGPLPFVLSGWQAWSGTRAYSGTMTRGDQVVTARPDGSRTSLIVR